MKIKDGFIIRKLAENYVVVPIDNVNNDFKGMIQLNETGAFLFEQLQQEKTLDELLALMLDKYDIDTHKAKNDVELFVAKLKKDGLLDD